MKQIKPDEKQRALSVLKKIIALLILGGVYALLVIFTDFGIPCPLRRITGFYCTGCGISRMLLALLHFNFKAAVKANVFVLCLLPFALIIIFYKAVRYIKKGILSDPFILNVFYLIVLISAITFGVLRNIDTFSFLAPH